MRTRGAKEIELVKFIEQRGFFTQADHTAVRVAHANGLSAEGTSEIILAALRRGRDPVTDVMYTVRSMKMAEARTTRYATGGAEGVWKAWVREREPGMRYHYQEAQRRDRENAERLRRTLYQQTVFGFADTESERDELFKRLREMGMRFPKGND